VDIELYWQIIFDIDFEDEYSRIYSKMNHLVN